MFRYSAVALWLLAAGGRLALSQATEDEFGSRIDLYVQSGEQLRLEFQNSYQIEHGSGNREGTAFFLEAALKPVLRRELRSQPDVFQRRYLTFRTGFQYTTNLGSGSSGSERRGILEVTSRYQIGGGIVLSDRNRGDFRFISGQPFSERYRNRLRVERDFPLGGVVVTPYVYDELFYDARFHAWSANRIEAGVRIPVGSRLIIEPYIRRQHNTRPMTSRVDVPGLILGLYF